MPTLTAASNDGYIRSTGTSRTYWTGARDATSGTSASSTSTRYQFAVLVRVTGTGASTANNMFRSYFYFDCSGITSTVSSATLKLFGYTSNSGDVIAVKSSAPNTDGSTALATGDWDAIPGFAAGQSMAGNVTDYSAEVTSWSTSAYNSITLNATALSDLQNNNAFQVCVVNYDHDYLNVPPSSGTSAGNGLYYQDYSGTGTDPVIEYTLATGDLASINTVAAGNIHRVQGIAAMGIASINGVDLP